MTTDDRLRDALFDLAPIAPADETAFAGVQRAVTRRRRRRTAGMAAAAVLAVSLVAGGALAAGQRDDEDDYVTRPPDRVENELQRVPFADMTFELPDGWEVISTGDAEDGTDEYMCIGPAGNPYPKYDDCAGLMLHHGDRLPGNEMDEYRDHAPWAWYHGTDVNPCPTGPYSGDPGEPFDGIQPGEAGYDPIETGERPVGDRTAVYDKWEARCELSGFTFTPRAWHLTESQIVIFDVLGQSETEAILASVRWDDGS
jgi:hypothetical protein